jgi:hypothetical protein
MKAPIVITILIIIGFLGCSSYFDEDNVVGTEYAQGKSFDRKVIDAPPVVLESQSGLKEAYSRIVPLTDWNDMGQCRFGYYKNDNFFAYVEFTVSNIPPDFDTLGDAGLPHRGDSLHGIDSIIIQLNFEQDSKYSGNILLDSTSIIIYECEKISKLVNGREIYYLGNRKSLDTVGIPLAAPDGSFCDTITVKAGTSPIYYYIRDSVLKRSSDIARFGLAFGLTASTANQQILTLDIHNPPCITLIGHSRHEYHVYSGDSLETWHEIKIDSIMTEVKVMNYVTPLTDAKVFKNNPCLSTVYYQYADMTADQVNQDSPVSSDSVPAGYFIALFKISKDSIFKELNTDSINILSATATFLNNLESQNSYTEKTQKINVILNCIFYDNKNQPFSLGGNVYATNDTTILEFIPEADPSITYPVNKYLAALTDSRYQDVETVEFGIRPYHYTGMSNSLNRMSRVVFQKQVRIDFKYSKR